ncbi:MAG: endonuclease/exonuclease/phosphatase family protein [Clostridia bacterium]|nr:endonuclease/exonuclease/phosphatase family protein [Clostridia bacterium]
MDPAYMAVAGIEVRRMKFVTFNIRCDFDQDKDNSFRFRKPLILAKIEKEKPDIICFQEVLPHVAAWLKDVLKEYYVVGCPRSETLEDEQESIAYRKDKYNLISMETFWMSPTPYRPGSRYREQSICPRVCTEVLLEDLEHKKVFRVINLHLDHIGVQARMLGLSQVLRKLEGENLFYDAPVIIAGDFNAEPDGEEIKIIDSCVRLRNVTENIGITYHGFEAEDEAERIDYIYVSDEILCEKTVKWEDQEEGVWLSDHYPVMAELSWKA